MSVILHLTPVSQQAANDGTATLFLYLQSDGERVTGLDFTFSTTAQLLSRDLTGSVFPDLVSGDLSGDLGGSVADVSKALAAGDWYCGAYKFRVQGVATTTITPARFPGTTGWVSQAPDFIERPFDGLQGAVVNFPEPGVVLSIILAFIFGWCLARRRRWR